MYVGYILYVIFLFFIENFSSQIVLFSRINILILRINYRKNNNLRSLNV